ncbi:MAG: hypothetical protein U0559_05315 [Anaerolineae bacterium]
MRDRWLLFKRNFANFWKIFLAQPHGQDRRVSADHGAGFGNVCADPDTLKANVRYDPRCQWARPASFAPPSVHGPLGTDDAGRDVYGQCSYTVRAFRY